MGEVLAHVQCALRSAAAPPQARWAGVAHQVAAADTLDVAGPCEAMQCVGDGAKLCQRTSIRNRSRHLVTALCTPHVGQRQEFVLTQLVYAVRSCPVVRLDVR